MDQNLVVIVFLQILMWALSKTPLKIYRERNSLQKFRMLQIEEGKHVYYVNTLVTLMFRTEVNISTQMVDATIIYSRSRTRNCWRDFLSSITDFK